MTKQSGKQSGKQAFAEDILLNRILNTLVQEVKGYAEFQRYHLNRYAEIGMAMSGEEDIARLLEMIVFEAREITDADAGTLYMVADNGQSLEFNILQNDTMDTRMGGTSGQAITLPPVPLYVDNEENHGNVSSHVALTGAIVNIPDVYESEEFDFTGPRKYDQATGYRSKSMMVIPMRNHENDIIGVLQLLNALDPDTGDTIHFSDDDVALIAALASQAAVAITKNRLIQGLIDLFNAFIRSIATAIEEKSKYTGGHIHRVASLTMDIAKKINEVDYGPFQDVHFSDDDLEELRVAAWLHDIGKITTPEFVVDKSAKLETIYDRIELVMNRFDLIARSMEADAMTECMALLEKGDKDGVAARREKLAADVAALEEDRAFVLECNKPGEFMADEKIEKLKVVAAKTYGEGDRAIGYLTDDEVENLCIRKGTLTNDERKVIENHALMTYKILDELPFPKKMRNVPGYAAGHHEKLDGTGYPWGLKASQISLQARIMAVADIFEALTAKDRPYKKPMKLSMAIRILGFMKKDRHIDDEVHDLFLQAGVMHEYAGEHLADEQVDIDLNERVLPSKVLIVADAGYDQEALMHTLEGWSLSVHCAFNAVQCFNMVQEARDKGMEYGLVILDTEVQGKPSATQAAKRLLEEGMVPEKIMLLHPTGKKGCRVAGRRHDCTLAKPFAVPELKEMVFAAFGREAPAGDFDVNAMYRSFQEDEPPSLVDIPMDGRRRILLVDDSINTRMLVSYYLKETPYAVVTAENGRVGHEKYATGLFDLVLMDLEMPVMDGYASARAMRDWELEHDRPRRPILALADYSFKGDDERREEAGFTSHIMKPIKKRDLVDIIDSYLGKPRTEAKGKAKAKPKGKKAAKK